MSTLAPMVSLDVLWLNDAADPRVAFGLQMLAGSQRSWPSKVAVRDYLGGRRRAVGTPRGASRVWTPTLSPAPLAVAEQLELLAGNVFWARDVLGGKVACIWADAPYSGLGPIGEAGEHLVQLSLTLSEISERETARRLGPR